MLVKLGRLAAAICIALVACAPPPPQSNGYKAGIRPGMTKAQAEALLGKGTSEAPFTLVTLSAFVMTYPFGQLLLEHGAVVAVTVADDPL